MVEITPNLEEASKYLKLLDHESEVFTFQTTDESSRKSWAKAKVFHGTFDQHADALYELNQAGAGIFVMVNKGNGIVYEGNRTCRTNANVVEVRALFVDADGAPLEPILENSPPPHIVVESSPGKWHVYWRTNDTRLEEFKLIQQTIAKKFNTDPAVNDLARVMRVPGFYHQKGEPFMTRLIHR